MRRARTNDSWRFKSRDDDQTTRARTVSATQASYDGCALVKPADEVEQKLTAGLSEWEVAQFVENDEVHPGQMFGEPALTSVAGLAFETVDEVDDVVKAPAGTGADAAPGDGYGGRAPF